MSDCGVVMFNRVASGVGDSSVSKGGFPVCGNLYTTVKSLDQGIKVITCVFSFSF